MQQLILNQSLVFKGFCFRFEDFTGRDIVRLKKVLQTAPEFYYSSLRDSLKISLLHSLRFTEALEDI